MFENKCVFLEKIVDPYGPIIEYCNFLNENAEKKYCKNCKLRLSGKEAKQYVISKQNSKED